MVWGFKLGFHVTFVHYSVVFHGHVGPCRIRRLCSDLVVVVYIYMLVAANSVLQVAVVCFCVVVFFALFHAFKFK